MLEKDNNLNYDTTVNRAEYFLIINEVNTIVKLHCRCIYIQEQEHEYRYIIQSDRKSV